MRGQGVPGPFFGAAIDTIDLKQSDHSLPFYADRGSMDQFTWSEISVGTDPSTVPGTLWLNNYSLSQTIL